MEPVPVCMAVQARSRERSIGARRHDLDCGCAIGLWTGPRPRIRPRQNARGRCYRFRSCPSSSPLHEEIVAGVVDPFAQDRSSSSAIDPAQNHSKKAEHHADADNAQQPGDARREDHLLPLRVGISNGLTGSTAFNLKSIGYWTNCSILCPSSVAGMNSIVFTTAIAASAKSLYVACVQVIDSGLACPEVSTTN